MNDVVILDQDLDRVMAVRIELVCNMHLMVLKYCQLPGVVRILHEFVVEDFRDLHLLD